MCQSLFFNKVATQPATLLKKKTLAWVFFCEFTKCFGTPFLTEQLQWVLLIIDILHGFSVRIENKKL